MVLPLAAAAQAAGAAGSAGATALGLGQGKSGLELTRDLFNLQMQQAKRLWAAEWAEASLRHGETSMQAAQQHAESQAMAMTAYYQAEKLASQGIKLARDQDSRNYEMAWRAEVRESLRDELANQYNRFSTVMLCDTVALSCVFSLVAEGSLPTESSRLMVNLYISALGISITLFSVSLWFAVIAVRRLHEHTAAILERKLFAQSEDLQKAWQYQLENNLPTSPNEIYLFNQAYAKWVARYLDPIGGPSINMLSIGIVAMFITAGLLTHNRYLIEYDAFDVVPIFWSMVFITSITVLYMKFAEDRLERKKEGVYDNSWQDQSTADSGPLAKISHTAKEMFSGEAVELGSTERTKAFRKREQTERQSCAATRALHHRVKSLRDESEQREKTRKEVLQLLTTATEELEALPEGLAAKLNKLLRSTDEADRRTADLVTIREEDKDSGNALKYQGSSRNAWSRLPSSELSSRQPMGVFPIDAQRLPVSLGAIRKKLGESSISTLLRIKNLSNEPLRLNSGVQMKEGKYLKSFNTTDPNNKSICAHHFPPSEIPPRSEVVVAALSRSWVPTSGIEGEIVYTNKDESWSFRAKFSNHMVRKVRKCQVKATRMEGNDEMENDDKFWSMERQELDIKANYEVAITIDVLQGERGRKASMESRRSQLTLKSGVLLKNRSFGFGLQWHQRWVLLSPAEIVYSESPVGKKASKIPLKDVTSVAQGSDTVKKNVFEIHTIIQGSEVIRFSASSPADMEDWIQNIRDACGIGACEDESSTGEDSSEQSVVQAGFECVEDITGTSVHQAQSRDSVLL